MLPARLNDYSNWDEVDISHVSELAICHVVLHGNQKNTIRLHCRISHSREILNEIHFAMAYNVTCRKLTIAYVQMRKIAKPFLSALSGNQ